MSDVRSITLQDRVRDWIERIRTSPVHALPASQLYAGDHWKVVLRIPQAAVPLDIRLWVASAGYGLVAIDTPLKPYSATFLRSHPETIAPPGTEFSTSEWWSAISEWHPGGHHQPRTLGQLATSLRSAQGVLLLALSAPYAQALRKDIDVAERIAPGQVALISVGLASEGDSSVPTSLLPVAARLKQTVGGAMQGVNARLAEKVVREYASWFPRVDRLDGLVREWVGAAAPLPAFHRAVQTDDDVKQFIREFSRLGYALSKSAALRAFRDSGRACEQTRFGRLYREVMDGTGSSGNPSVGGRAGDSA
jgi:hypothetical protein